MAKQKPRYRIKRDAQGVNTLNHRKAGAHQSGSRREREASKQRWGEEARDWARLESREIG